MSQNTTRFLLPLMAGNQNQKHVIYNDLAMMLDVLLHLSVKDRGLTAPPGSPADGDCYMPASGATGAWDDWDLNIAAYQNGGWIKYVPTVGMRCFVEDEKKLLVFTGLTWEELAAV